MPIFKATMLFQQVTAASSPNAPVRRLAGWSESWYGNFADQPTCLGFLVIGGVQGGPAVNNPVGARILTQDRGALLNIGQSIVGVRVQQVSPPGPTIAFPVNVAGGTTQEDIPQMAMLCSAKGLGVNNTKRFTVRGMTDSIVVEGEFNQGNISITEFQNFFKSLGNWAFRGRDLSQTTFKIVNIIQAANVLVTTELPYAPAVGSFVRILKSKDTSGNLRGGRFQVLTLGPLANQFTIGLWNFGSTTGGSVRTDATIYPAVDPANCFVLRIVTRRVGRPFVQYRGRRSRRR